jgi:hypothetical protein
VGLAVISRYLDAFALSLQITIFLKWSRGNSNP